MKLIIDIDEDEYKFLKTSPYPNNIFNVTSAIANGTPIPDNATNGKEILIKYCLEHSGEEIYDLLKKVFDASMGWTDSRGYIIEWLEKGQGMNKKLAELNIRKSADYYDKVVKALKDAGFVLVLDCETSTEKYYIVAESEDKDYE